jgi:hypothetical protein
MKKKFLCYSLAVVILIAAVFMFGAGNVSAQTPQNAPPTGWIDGANSDHVWGWAYDADAPSSAVSVSIYVGGVFAGTAAANVSKPDLVTNGATADPYHGFDYFFTTFPNRTLPAGTHYIDVYPENLPLGSISTTVSLQGSPKAVYVSSYGGTTCGNGVIDTGEQCDASAMGAMTCTNSAGYSGGTLKCSSTCKFDYSSCVPLGGTTSVCGNGVIDTGEQCDQGNSATQPNLGGATCTSLGKTGGTLKCSSACTFDTSMCTTTTATTNSTPTGWIDGADQTHVWGWIYDSDGTNQYAVYVDGIVLSPLKVANVSKPDLVTNGAAPDAYHGFDYVFPSGGLSQGTHTIKVEAFNYPTGTAPARVEIQGSPKTVVVGTAGATTCFMANLNYWKDTKGACHPPCGTGYSVNEVTGICVATGTTSGSNVCGNGVIEGNEACDGTAFGGNTCSTVTAGKYATGTLSCTANCTFDTAKCTLASGGISTNTAPKGWVEEANTTHVKGWAYDADVPTTALRVAIFIDGKIYTAISADLPRTDLVTAGVAPAASAGALPTTNHGFDYTMPTLAPGLHVVEVQAQNLPTGGTAVWLEGSPKTIGTTTDAAAACPAGYTKSSAGTCVKSTQTAPATCGNGVHDTGEECDYKKYPAIAYGTTCASKLSNSSATGTLTCTQECKISTAQCTVPVLLNQECILAAVENREAALVSAFDIYGPVLKEIIGTRKAALKAAWSIADQTQRKAAIKAAWSSFNTSKNAAIAALKKAKTAAWTAYTTARKACGTNAYYDDTTSSYVDMYW